MPEARLEAVIWDLDGVIVDSGPYHFRAWRQVFLKRGVDFTAGDFKRNFGQRNDTIIKTVLGSGLSTAEVDAIAEDKEQAYRQFITGNVSPLPGVLELLRELHQAGIRMAIASSAPPENIELINRSLNTAPFFQAIVWGREVTEGKPSPQVFLMAASRLKTRPPDCVVIEDSVAGVTAARRAGMKCVAVTNTHPADRLKEADLVVASLEQVNLEVLQALSKGDRSGKISGSD